MSQQPQQEQRKISIFIPLVEAIRRAETNQDIVKLLASRGEAKVAILRGFIYIEQEGSQGGHSENELKLENQDVTKDRNRCFIYRSNKIVHINDPCHKVIGVIFEFRQEDINDVGKILTDIYKQQEITLVTPEVLPSYDVVYAFIPLEFIHIIRGQTQLAQDINSTMERLLRRDGEVYHEYKYKVETLKSGFERKGFNNLANALGALRRSNIILRESCITQV